MGHHHPYPGGPVRRHYSILTPIFVLLLAPTMRAQAPPDSGLRVRITSPEAPRGKLIGILERIAPDTVVVSGQLLSRSTISRFEVSAGSRSRWLAGMGIGLAG